MIGLQIDTRQTSIKLKSLVATLCAYQHKKDEISK